MSLYISDEDVKQCWKSYQIMYTKVLNYGQIAHHY